MRAPVNDESRERLRKALKSLAHDPAFETVLDWIKDELTERDKENRILKFENQTSEAHALAVILDHAAACAASTSGDGEEVNEGAESEPAETTHMTA